MKRREFIAGLGGAAAWPVVARGQENPRPVVGFIAVPRLEALRTNLEAFNQSLKDAGYIDGQTIAIEYRSTNGDYDQISTLAADVVKRQVQVIVAGGGAQVAAKNATTTIPIVSIFAGDPVKSGLVAGLDRPGGNVTGVNMLTYALGAKRFEFLREAAPTAKVIAVLVNSNNPDPETKNAALEVEAAARAIGQQISVLNASSESDFESAFAKLGREGNGALLVMADPFFNSRRTQIIALAARYAIPAIYEWREFAEDGGLMAYGSSLVDAYRQIGVYTAKILSGVKPADLPVTQAVKVELVLNLKTAKTLGVAFPLSVLGRADKVIE
jgi:putative ABC transport system substrate-binding protein